MNAIAYLDRFVSDLLTDAMNNASAAHWRQRAQEFEDARPRVGDYPGRATPAQRRARDARLAEIAEACRNHASILDGTWVQRAEGDE